jgi:uncharacterized protein (TIGR02466 family)
MSSVDIFPTKIYHVSSDVDCQQMLDAVVDILASSYREAETNNQGSMRGNGLCSYNASRRLHQRSEFQSLIAFIEKHATAYWQDLGYMPSQRPKVFEMWTNVYKKDSFIDMHSHSPIQMTASFYLQQPADGGNLAFEHPMMQLMKHQPYEHALIRYHSEAWEHDVPVKTGDLVLFPGYLNHRTRPNQSDSDRIIIGANLCGV